MLQFLRIHESSLRGKHCLSDLFKESFLPNLRTDIKKKENTHIQEVCSKREESPGIEI